MSNAKVVVTFTPRGIERVQVAASSAHEEKASLKLYEKMQPVIHAIRYSATRDGDDD